MAAETMKYSSWNPLNIYQTDLPPNMLLAAKVLAIALFIAGFQFDLSDHFLPMLSFFDYMGPPKVFAIVLQAGFYVSSLMIFFNLRARLGCLMLGLVLFTAILSSRLIYSNAKFFSGCIFFLISLHKKGDKPDLIRWQLVLVYFGAAINKFFDPDWQSGIYFEYWMGAVIENHTYIRAADALPELLLSKLMCWLTIVIEVVMGGAFLFKRFVPFAIWVGVYFHAGTYYMSGYGFAIFLAALLSSYLACIEWSPESEIQTSGHWLQKLKTQIFYSPTAWIIGSALFSYNHWRWKVIKPYFFVIVLVLICPIWDLLLAKMRRKDA